MKLGTDLHLVPRLRMGRAIRPASWVWDTRGIKWPGHEADHSPPSSAMELYHHCRICVHGVLCN
jgi:hypothetical protein